MTELFGILNITPDSFTDGGNYTSVEDAIAHAKRMYAEGAAVIDVGAESTRPGATPLTHAEEWARLEPVLTALQKLPIPVSLDSYHPESIRKGLALGVRYINDVTGFSNSAMIEVAKQSNADLITMHNLGLPVRPDVTLPVECDVIARVHQDAETHIRMLESHGIKRDRIIFDPGIGFGKTAEQSLTLLKECSALHALGVKILIGHSRKSCFKALSPGNTSSRDPETHVMSAYLASQNIQYLRVHDVLGNAKALRVGAYLQ